MRLNRVKPRKLIALLTPLVAVGLVLAAATLYLRVRDPDLALTQPPFDRRLSGGEGTVAVLSIHSFGHSAGNLPTELLAEFAVGNRLFNTNWVEAPASVDTFDGLGPVFNRSSCSGCHLRDGRGRPPRDPNERMASMLIRLSLPGEGPHGGPLADPRYGDQLNDQGITGVPAEGRATVEWVEVPGTYPDGTAYSLRAPKFAIVELAFGALGQEVQISARVAPHLAGVGLLEAVAAETVRGFADEQDANGDGISGRANEVWDFVLEQSALGRFGWKAGQPSLLQQNAIAAVQDIGITNYVFPDENIGQSQTAAAEAPSGQTNPEMSFENLRKLTAYTQMLAVPARRRVDDPVALRGEQIFAQVGCSGCHVPSMTTGEHPTIPALTNQLIHPYTDLLLHDMGPDLADGRPEFLASGSEWRTPPLWGLGLVRVVNKHTNFLHDGRARNFEEAILWHGGEAELSREQFRNLSRVERDALILFLESL